MTDSVSKTLESTAVTLRREVISSELVVVDDGSPDSTVSQVQASAQKYPEIRLSSNEGRHGFGTAVRRGLDEFTGEAVAITMADGRNAAEGCCPGLPVCHDSDQLDESHGRDLEVEDQGNGSRYLFTVLYLWLEKHLARDDYHRLAGNGVVTIAGRP
jgi:glycosyltransferase involved in cell wall biosynthesis